MASPFARHRPVPSARPRAQQLELFDLPVETAPACRMAVPPWCGLAAWHRELDRQSAIMRPRTPLYHRFEATARQLTRERIRASAPFKGARHREAIVAVPVRARVEASTRHRDGRARFQSSSGAGRVGPTYRPIDPGHGGAP